MSVSQLKRQSFHYIVLFMRNSSSTCLLCSISSVTASVSGSISDSVWFAVADETSQFLFNALVLQTVNKRVQVILIRNIEAQVVLMH